MDHLIIAIDEKIIEESVLESFQIEYELCLKLLNGFIQYLKTKKHDEMK